MKEIWDNIYVWWHYTFLYYPKNIKIGLKNLWVWFPVIWKDRNWDPYYIYSILEQKLKFQANYIEKRDLHKDTLKDVRNMKIASNLINKVKNDFYENEYLDYETSDFEFIEKDTKYILNIKRSNDHYQDYFNKYPLIYKKVLNGEGYFPWKQRNEEDHNRLIAMNMAYLNQKRAQNLLFKIINEHINSWWD